MSDERAVAKQVSLKLVGLDGNAFTLLAAFSKRARREDWSEEELDTVLDDAKSGDYSHLLKVLSDHCVDGGM